MLAEPLNCRLARLLEMLGVHRVMSSREHQEALRVVSALVGFLLQACGRRGVGISNDHEQGSGGDPLDVGSGLICPGELERLDGNFVSPVRADLALG